MLKPFHIICLTGFCLTGLPACQTKMQQTDREKGKPMAKVNAHTLYLSDVAASCPKNISKSDSVAFVRAWIHKWAKNQVFYDQALRYLSEEEQSIDAEMEAYKRELLSYKFQAKLVNEKLDTLVTQKQIEDYYNQHAQSFVLKQNILKVLYVKTPVSISNLDKLKKLCYSNNPKDGEQLKNFCIQYANNYYMNDNTWLMLDDLKKEIPQLNEVPDYSIQRGKIVEFTDANSFYFLKIIDVKSKNTPSPLHFETTHIKNRIINQRKQQLINTIQNDFFNEAQTTKELEIYN